MPLSVQIKQNGIFKITPKLIKAALIRNSTLVLRLATRVRFFFLVLGREMIIYIETYWPSNKVMNYQLYAAAKIEFFIVEIGYVIVCEKHALSI